MAMAAGDEGAFQAAAQHSIDRTATFISATSVPRSQGRYENRNHLDLAGTGERGVTPDGAPIKGTLLNGPRRSISTRREISGWPCARETRSINSMWLGGVIHHAAAPARKGLPKRRPGQGSHVIRS